MSEESLDISSENFEAPEHLLPHEEGFGEPAPADSNVDITEPAPADTPDYSDNEYISVGDDGALNVDVPEDEAEFEKFYESLPPDLKKQFNEDFKDEIDPEAAQPEGNNQGDVEGGESSSEVNDLTHNIDQQAYDALPDEVKTYVDDIKTRLDNLANYENEDYRKGLDNFLQDPVVSQRYKELTGQADASASLTSEQLFSVDNLTQLGLDFDFDKENSAAKLQGIMTQAIRQAETRVHDHYRSENAQRDYKSKLEGELQKIQTIDDSLASDLDFGDPKHPMKEFMDWLLENEKNINLVNIGGVDTYKLYMAKTGKEVPDVASTVRKDVVRNIAKAKSTAARTLPRNMKSSTDGDREIVHGIDVQKFKTDESYAQAIYEQHGHDPAMLKTLRSMSFGN
jgi:hypothetical protein